MLNDSDAEHSAITIQQSAFSEFRHATILDALPQ
jgi:hypothetical protein